MLVEEMIEKLQRLDPKAELKIDHVGKYETMFYIWVGPHVKGFTVRS